MGGAQDNCRCSQWNWIELGMEEHHDRLFQSSWDGVQGWTPYGATRGALGPPFLWGTSSLLQPFHFPIPCSGAGPLPSHWGFGAMQTWEALFAEAGLDPHIGRERHSQWAHHGLVSILHKQAGEGSPSNQPAKHDFISKSTRIFFNSIMNRNISISSMWLYSQCVLILKIAGFYFCSVVWVWRGFIIWNTCEGESW